LKESQAGEFLVKARHKDRTDFDRLFRHDGIIVNSVFKSCPSQSLDRLVQCLHCAAADSTPFAATS